MTGYTKLFGSIVASTIWRDKNETRLVWITMLAVANRNGVVEASIPGLADLARVSVEDCEEALVKLSSPDPYSRTKDHEGRRIGEVDGGWQILNYEKYRRKMSADERREYFRLKKKQSREGVQLESTNVKECPQCPHIAEAEAEAEAKDIHTPLSPLSGVQSVSTLVKECPQPETSPPPEQPKPTTRPSGLPATEAEAVQWADMEMVPAAFASEVFHQCEGVNWMDGANRAITNWRSYIRSRWTRRQEIKTDKPARGPTVSELRAAVQVKEEKAAAIRQRHCSDMAMGPQWSDAKAQQQYVALRKEIRRLKDQIESTVCTSQSY